MPYEVAIIGAGLFGQMAYHALRSKGVDSIIMFDSMEPDRGSAPAACLMKPGWFDGLGEKVSNPALDLLDELFGLQKVRFQLGPRGVDVFWVPPSAILSNTVTYRQVSWIHAGTPLHMLTLDNGDAVDARHVIVAAGYWTQHLLPEIKLEGMMGRAVLYKAAHIEQPYIEPWAPFKQIVAFNRGDGLWGGDGSAIKKDNWTESRGLDTEKRVLDSLLTKKVTGVLGAPFMTMDGIRPYAKYKSFVLEEVRPRVWAATGGAKNGTITAAYCARVLRETIG